MYKYMHIYMYLYIYILICIYVCTFLSLSLSLFPHPSSTKSWLKCVIQEEGTSTLTKEELSNTYVIGSEAAPGKYETIHVATVALNSKKQLPSNDTPKLHRREFRKVLDWGVMKEMIEVVEKLGLQQKQLPSNKKKKNNHKEKRRMSELMPERM